MEKISAARAAILLGLSTADLALLEKRGLLHTVHSTGGVSFYSAEEIASIKYRQSMTLAQEAALVETGMQRKVASAATFARKAVMISGGVLAGYILLVVVFTVLFITAPLATASFLGYVPSTGEEKAFLGPGRVLAATTDPLPETPSLGRTLFQPVGSVSLALVKVVNPEAYAQVANVVILDPNDLFGLDGTGAITPERPIRLPDTSLLQVESNGLIANLNSDYVQGLRPGNNPGDLAIVGEALQAAQTVVTADGNPPQESTVLTIATDGPLQGGGTFSLGDTLALSCPTCALTIESLFTPGSADTLTNKIIDGASNTITGLTVDHFVSPGISQWTNDAGFVTASATETLSNKIISAVTNTITGLTATNLTAGDYSSKITSGTYDISITGSVASATDFTGSLAGDVTGTQGATVISGLTVSHFGSANISQWTNDVGFVTASTTDTLINKTISGTANTITGLTVGHFGSANISQWTNDSGFITASGIATLSNKVISGATNTITGLTTSNFSSAAISQWTNDLGFTTASGAATLTNKTIAAGSNTISGLTTSNFSSANLSQWTNDSGFITTSGTETLSNKTISGLTNTLTNIANSSLINSGLTVAGNTGSGSVSLGGTLTVLGSGINTAAYSGGTVTVTGTEADTLAAVTGRGATSATALTLSHVSNAITAGTLTATGGTINDTTIGATTPSTGAFTALSSTGATTLASAGASNVAVATTGTGNVAIGNATGTFGLTSNGGLNVTTLGALTGVTSLDTIATSATGLTFAGAGTISSTTASALTLDSGTTGTINIGTGTAGKAINIGTDNTTKDTIAIGSALDDVAITADQWSVTDAGVLTVASCTGCGSTTAKHVVKGTDENVASGTTLQNDDALTFAVGSGETWVFQFNLLVTNLSSNVPDWKAAILGASGWTCSFAMHGEEPGNSAFPQVAGTDCDNAPTAVVNATIASDAGIPFEIVMQGSITTTSAGSVTLQWAPNTSGSLTVKAGSFVTAQKVGGSDLAEIYYTTDSTIRPGDVVSMDSSIPAGVKKSTTPYDPQVLGIISTKPGLLLGDGETNTTDMPVMLALAGRLPVAVSGENGPIQAGDYLTSSAMPGVAMKATKAGTIIGTAMSPFMGEGVGQVLAFVKNGSAMGNAVDTDKHDVLTQWLGSQTDDALSPTHTVADESGPAENTIEKKFLAQITRVVTQVFAGSIEFFGTLLFHGDVTFVGRPTFTNDTAGHALVTAGHTEVQVTFANAYSHPPVVTANVTLRDGLNISDVPAYAMYDVSNTGFKIVLSRAAPVDLSFAWIAVLVPETDEVGDSGVSTLPAAVPTPSSPDVSVLPTPISSDVSSEPQRESAAASPSPTPSQEILPSPTPSIVEVPIESTLVSPSPSQPIEPVVQESASLL